MAIVLTSNAKYNPYGFDRLLKPLAMYTEEYNKVEEGISELGTKAEVLRAYANEEPNSEIANQYNSFADELDKQADALAKQGLREVDRSKLWQMNRRYARDISPIEEAIAARKDFYKSRSALKSKDPNIIFKNDGRVSLSEFMNGNTADDSYISGKDITARVLAKSQAVGTELFNSYVAQGYSAEDALVLAKSNNSFKKIQEDEWNALGASGYSQSNQDKIRNAINTGTMGAFNNITEGEYMSKKEREALDLQKNQLAEQRRQHDLQYQAKGFKVVGNKLEVDEESPIWTAHGIEWKDGKPVSSKDTGESEFIPGGGSDNSPLSLPATATGIAKVIGREWGNIWRKGKEIKGVEYSISGSGTEAEKAKTFIINSLQGAYSNGTAIVMEDRGGFKIGSPKSDVPMNMYNDFGDIIKKDNEGNFDIDVSNELKIIYSTDTVSYEGKSYNLSDYILVSVPTSNKTTVYVGIPINTNSSTNPVSNNSKTPSYNGGW